MILPSHQLYDITERMHNFLSVYDNAMGLIWYGWSEFLLVYGDGMDVHFTISLITLVDPGNHGAIERSVAGSASISLTRNGFLIF